MGELLDAEDIVLKYIEEMLDEAYQRDSLLHEERINESWLEEKLSDIINGTVHVNKVHEKLSVEITVNTGEIVILQADQVEKLINKYLPAHLAYELRCEKNISSKSLFGCIWQDDEIMTLSEVKV
jgi:hypothetical protein